MYDEFDNTEMDRNQEVSGGAEPRPEDTLETPFMEESLEAEVSQPEDLEYEETETVYAQTDEAEIEVPYTGASHERSEGSGAYHYQYNGQPEGEPQMDEFRQAAGDGGYSSQQPKEFHKNKSGRPLWKSFALCTSMALVFGVVASAAFQVTDYIGSQFTPKETEQMIGNADPIVPSDSTSTPVSGAVVSTAGDVSQVAKNTMPSIVAITNKGVEEVESMFFGQRYTQQTESAGSGVIVAENDTELLIATNNHVVEGAEELTVCFSADLENPEDAVVKAQIKGTDSDHDLAVVAVNKSDIPEDVKNQIKVINIGDSAALAIGQQVIAIGNALGYGQSVTVGYISAMDREVTIDDITNNLIQTDAAINFGNSGGALLNAAGELIGINSAKAAASGVEGMGYAIPMGTAQPILNDLMNRTTRTKVDESEKGYLGIVPRDVSEEAKEVYNMPAGAYVYEVTEGEAAAEAGIKKGDIIVKIDGESISSSDDLYERMNYYTAGETVDIIIATAQNGEYIESTVSVTFGKRPADTETTESSEEQQTVPEDNYGDMYDYYYNYGGGGNGQSMNPFEQLIP